jgi:hypothetical protein
MARSPERPLGVTARSRSIAAGLKWDWQQIVTESAAPTENWNPTGTEALRFTRVRMEADDSGATSNLAN